MKNRVEEQSRRKLNVWGIKKAFLRGMALDLNQKEFKRWQGV